MCGLSGVAWSLAGGPVDAATLDRMTDILRHRGPDDRGIWTSPTEQTAYGVSLGHRRLSIIDLAGGHQPLANEDGTVLVVFNGEIYNYLELHAELERKGHRFRTVSDTEVLVHLYEECGRDMLDRLRGMFAFAIWDQRRGLLLLARDRLGKKPLVYRHAAGRLWFASELKSLLQAPDAPRQVDPRALADFVARQYIPHPRTIFEGFQKLPPAHWLQYDAVADQIESGRYWQPQFCDSSPGADSVETWQRRLRETLTEAVRIRLRSDVPLGAFLSGGVDSTIVTGLMRQLSDQPVRTYSIGFTDPQYDERTQAQAVANHLGTVHREEVIAPHALEILPRLLWHYDEPFADSSAIPTMWLSEFARQEVTVALTGDGGDELFCGYDRYRAVELAGRIDRLPAWVRRGLASQWWQRLPGARRQKSRMRKMQRFLGGIALSPEERYADWMSIFDRRQRAGLFHPEFLEELDGYEPDCFLLDLYDESTLQDFVQRTTSVDLGSYLPCDILTKVDIASMACGLECRSPLLDQQVAELAASMPRSLKRAGRVGKKILRETFADLIPPENRTLRKSGFGVPLDAWFRGELRPLLENVLLSDRCLSRRRFRPEVVRNLVGEHVSGRTDHSARLWLMLMLELWQRMSVDQTPSTSPPSLQSLIS
jgi:asparagine synthase (glutamine-hydrolysing)